MGRPNIAREEHIHISATDGSGKPIIMADHLSCDTFCDQCPLLGEDPDFVMY